VNWRGLATIAISSLALAGDALSDARALYARGEFGASAKLASSLGTSEGYILAARALSLEALTSSSNAQIALYEQAEHHAGQALEKNARDPDAHFELARATGRLGELRGIAAALVNGVATRVKQSLERSLQLEPDHGEARVALGAWHAQVSARGGIAASLLGANQKLAEPLILSGLKLQPRNIGHHLEYARTLLLLDAARNRSRALEVLRAAVKLVPADAEQRWYLGEARVELERLK
jgi:tetratricopeptide (TPR) repeat protein